MVRIKEISQGVKQGGRYGEWKILGKPFSSGNGRLYSVVVQCKCGLVAVRYCHRLHGDHGSRSCGRCALKWKTHGDSRRNSRRRLYRIWGGIKRRCDSPRDAAYNRYGGRGIQICEEWKSSYQAFKEWSLANGYTDRLEIDRRDNDGNYCPENCRWVTKKENSRNTRRTHRTTAFGETKSLVEWSEDIRCLVPYGTLCTRIGSGWEFETALTTLSGERNV